MEIQESDFCSHQRKYRPAAFLSNIIHKWIHTISTGKKEKVCIQGKPELELKKHTAQFPVPFPADTELVLVFCNYYWFFHGTEEMTGNLVQVEWVWYCESNESLRN
jgi:hypothetical protein